MRRVRPTRMRGPLALALLGLGLMAGCARTARPAAEEAGPLMGLRLPLVPGAGRRLAVEGRVGQVPARVVLEVAAPLALVSDACFRQPPRGTGATVRVPQPSGGLLSVREVVLSGLVLESRRLPPLTAGLREGASACEVVLGSDTLAPYALEVDPVARQVAFAPSQSAEAAAALPEVAGEERRVLPLTRDPTTDWLLLPARAAQGEARLTGPFVLSTGEEASVVSTAAATAEGLQAASGRFALDALELAPDFPLTHLQLGGEGTWANPGAHGVLGADVWGRFRTTLDVRAGVLVLRRPAAAVQGGAPVCADAAGGLSPQACLAPHVRALGEGRQEVGLTVWRALPQGGHVALEAQDAEGRPLGEACRVTFSFPPSGRGEGLSQVLPLPGAGPGCDWGQVASLVPGEVQPGPLAACEGVCLAVAGPQGPRCACRAGSAGGAAPAPAPSAPARPEAEEPEPEDP